MGNLFKKGDVVKLKSGTRKMTIKTVPGETIRQLQSTGKNVEMHDIPVSNYLCIYEDNDKFSERWFEEHLLMLAP
ncbi:DUF2158 domain-containing protein [Acetobacteraceae bacterium ESL0709]|nr:DUF2158 domain-containing protein [Acetobacteraceae bacterium ESL0697]MDF7677821.1 DUF2158 domain-containing protein [Acetobacteraceae bacterium ESL0709]